MDFDGVGDYKDFETTVIKYINQNKWIIVHKIKCIEYYS